MSETVPRPESLVERATEVLRKRIGEGRTDPWLICGLQDRRRDIIRWHQ